MKFFCISNGSWIDIRQWMYNWLTGGAAIVLIDRNNESLSFSQCPPGCECAVHLSVTAGSHPASLSILYYYIYRYYIRVYVRKWHSQLIGSPTNSLCTIRYTSARLSRRRRNNNKYVNLLHPQCCNSSERRILQEPCTPIMYFFLSFAI